MEELTLSGNVDTVLFERLPNVQPEKLSKGKLNDTMRMKMSQKKAHWEKQELITKNLALKKLLEVFPEAKSQI